jgi:hypothetical protein
MQNQNQRSAIDDIDLAATIGWIILNDEDARTHD